MRNHLAHYKKSFRPFNFQTFVANSTVPSIHKKDRINSTWNTRWVKIQFNFCHLCFLLIEFCLDFYDLCLPDCLRLLPVTSGNLDQSLFLLSLQHSTCSSYSTDKLGRKSDGIKSKRFFRSRRSQHGQHIGISCRYVINMPERIKKYTSLAGNKICNVNLH